MIPWWLYWFAWLSSVLAFAIAGLVVLLSFI
jgi:hypothetical protein